MALGRLRRWGGNELVRSMAAIFINEMPKRFTELQTAIANSEAAQGERAAHSMVSSAAQLGAEELVVVCSAVEKLLSAGNLPAAASSIGKIRVELQSFSAWLTANVSDA